MSKYIKLEDVQKILDEVITGHMYYSSCDRTYVSFEVSKLGEQINSLPSIDFEEMIKEVQDKYGIGNKKIDVLEELLNKLP